MCLGNRKRGVTTMVTYSHASTPLGQSERAYYLSYFIKTESFTFGNKFCKIFSQYEFLVQLVFAPHRFNKGIFHGITI